MAAELLAGAPPAPADASPANAAGAASMDKIQLLAERRQTSSTGVATQECRSEEISDLSAGGGPPGAKASTADSAVSPPRDQGNSSLHRRKRKKDSTPEEEDREEEERVQQTTVSRRGRVVKPKQWLEDIPVAERARRGERKRAAELESSRPAQASADLTEMLSEDSPGDEDGSDILHSPAPWPRHHFLLHQKYL